MRTGTATAAAVAAALGAACAGGGPPDPEPRGRCWEQIGTERLEEVLCHPDPRRDVLPYGVGRTLNAVCYERSWGFLDFPIFDQPSTREIAMLNLRKDRECEQARRNIVRLGRTGAEN